MSHLPASLTVSLKNIKGFDEQAFEQVHASGEQVTSVRFNPGKVMNVEWGMVNGDALTTDNQPASSNLQSAIANLQSSGNLQSAIANLQSEIPWCPNAFYLSSRPSFTFDPLFHAGVYYVQEASSMFLWEALRQTVGANTQGVKVLDLCAAPGGKSTLLATYFANGLVVANEVIRSRAAILTENLTKWGSANTVVTNNDPKNFAALEAFFDVMVVDAPCSGSGLFRKDEDSITEWSEENVLLCSQRQQRILADAYAALKKDGLLVYCTCSYSKQEDEDIVDWICDELGAQCVRLQTKPGWGIVEAEGVAAGAFGYRFYPYLVKGEGFFMAVFRKKTGGSGTKLPTPPAALQKVTKEEAAAIAPLITERDEYFYFRQGENIIAAPAALKNDIAFLQKRLYLRKAGVTVGMLKGRDIVPAHGLAVSLIAGKNIQRGALTYQQAIQYLQKKDIADGNFTTGWTLATYAGANLGWMKVLPNRINNYYPVEWRILKDAVPS